MGYITSLYKVGGSGGKGSFAVVDNNGTIEIKVNGTKVLTAQQVTIADPAGGATQDAEARTAIASIIDALQAHGLIA
jgi:uncharacterized protein YxjI